MGEVLRFRRKFEPERVRRARLEANLAETSIRACDINTGEVLPRHPDIPGLQNNVIEVDFRKQEPGDIVA